MPTVTKRKETSRSRKRMTVTTGIVVHTAQDARGFCEPLTRYGELPTPVLGDFYNLANGNALTSTEYRNRLTKLFHESAGFTQSRHILTRPEYQWRHGINHPTVYRKAFGTALTLSRFGIYDERALLWANNTQIVQFVHGGAPSDHDAALSIAAASLELEARKHLPKFATHIDILKNSNIDPKTVSPLSIPIAKLAHTFTGAQRRTEVTNTFVKPDFLCGLGYPGNAWKFCALEYDRTNEDIEPTKNLAKSSWLRKFLAYSAISSGTSPVYERYLNIPNLLVLCMFEQPARMEHARQVARKYATYPSQFLFMTVPRIDPLLDAKVLKQIFHGDWPRANGTKFSLATGKEVM